MAAFSVAGTLVDRSGAAIVCFIASLARALLVAGAAAVLVVLPPGTAETVTVMALAAVTGALTQFSFILTEADLRPVLAEGPHCSLPSSLSGCANRVDKVFTTSGFFGKLLGPWMVWLGLGLGLVSSRAGSVSERRCGRPCPPQRPRAWRRQATQGQQLLTAKRRRRPASGPRTAPAPPPPPACAG
ncbi:hypothetical protein ACWC7P_45615, partial [Streptomyces sp. NPDC001275]